MKPASQRRTLMDVDYRKHAPDLYQESKYPYPYPWLIRNLDENEDDRFQLGEPSIFSDVLDYEGHAYFEPHASMAGAITVHENGKIARRLMNERKGYVIPNWVEADGLTFSSVRAKGILLVERGIVYEALLKINAPRRLNMIVFSGFGIPRMPARRLLYRLNREFELPVYVLADNDLWGYFIFSVLKRGMLAPHASSEFHAVNDVRYLGLRAGEVERHGSRELMIKPNTHWDVRLKALREYPCFRSKVWQREFDAFQQQRGKFELDAISRRGATAFLESYLLPKIESNDYLT
jgi:DNA topoisomerase VI subunit A